MWLTVLLLAAPSVSPSPVEGEPGCPQAISAANAQALYAALKDFQGADGCKLENVRTDKDVMRVEWKKDGVSAPLVEIRPLVCGRGTTVNGREFSMSAPPGALEECPAAVEKMKSLVAGEQLGGALRLDRNSEHKGKRWLIALAAAAGALVVAVAAFVMFRRRRRRNA